MTYDLVIAINPLSPNFHIQKYHPRLSSFKGKMRYFCICVSHAVACTTDETKRWFSLSAKQRQNPCAGFPPVYQDFSMRHDWPVKKSHC